MKKFITFTLSVLLTVFCFTACSQEKEMEYIALEVGGYDHILSSGALHSSDIMLHAETFKEEKLIGTTKTFSYNGIDYEATYDDTQKAPWANSTIHIYTYSEYGIWISFGINTFNGRLDYYSCNDLIGSSKNTVKTPKSKEECLQIARAHLGKFVDDPDAYKVDGANTFNLSEGLTYLVRFSRRVNGIPATDEANISVTEYGEIIAYHFVALGELGNFSFPAQGEMQKIQAAVDTKLASIYSPAKESYNYSHELESQELMKLEDGRYLLQQTYRTTLTRADGTESTLHDTTVLVVPLTQ